MVFGHTRAVRYPVDSSTIFRNMQCISTKIILVFHKIIGIGRNILCKQCGCGKQRKLCKNEWHFQRKMAFRYSIIFAAVNETEFMRQSMTLFRNVE